MESKIGTKKARQIAFLAARILFELPQLKYGEVIQLAKEIVEKREGG